MISYHRKTRAFAILLTVLFSHEGFAAPEIPLTTTADPTPLLTSTPAATLINTATPTTTVPNSTPTLTASFTPSVRFITDVYSSKEVNLSLLEPETMTAGTTADFKIHIGMGIYQGADPATLKIETFDSKERKLVEWIIAPSDEVATESTTMLAYRKVITITESSPSVIKVRASVLVNGIKHYSPTKNIVVKVEQDPDSVLSKVASHIESGDIEARL